MRFADRAGREYSLFEASCLGSPEAEGPFFPSGEDDLRPAIYAPDSSYTYFAASALAALFSGDIDPRLSLRLAESCFAEAPPLLEIDEGIAALDLGRGPTGSRADQDAAFLAALLGQAVKQGGPRLVLAESGGAEGLALAEAMSGIEGLETVLLYPEGSNPSSLRPELLRSEGGCLRIISVRGGRDQVAGLISAAAGKKLGGREITAAGPANPARIAARILQFAAIFASYRSRAAGEFFFGLPESDGIGLASCLWAWRLGVPLTGAVLPFRSGLEKPGFARALGSEGHKLVSRLDEERPGLMKSLVAFREADPAAAAEFRGRLDSAGAPRIDPECADILAAASRMLDSGLRGHAKVFALVERSLATAKAGRHGAPAPDASIEPSLSELSAVLAR